MKHLRSLPVLLRGSAFALLVLCSAYTAVADVASPMVYPLLGTRVSSDYGYRIHPIKRFSKHHNGIDLAAPEGAIIRAIKEGVVIFADPFGAYGNFVVLQHVNGMTSHYGHCDTIAVSPGQRVRAGEVIATVGKTGAVTGPHLHFEIRRDGNAEDPEKYLPGLALEGEG